MDFSGVPIVDNHAHPLTRAQPSSGRELREHFTEAHSPALAREHVSHAVYYRWALRQLASLFGTGPGEDSVVRARNARPFRQYVRELASSANLAYLLLDDGYPPPDEAYGLEEMEEMLGVPVRRILRIETLVQNLIGDHEHLADVVLRFDSALSDLRPDGCVALKSIAAYRTGLAIESAGEREVEEAYVLLKRDSPPGQPIRLTSKPLLDYFVLRALRAAAAQQIPFQFHTGYGDPDLDLRLANPLHLRPLFEDAELAGAPIVLLHESFPFTEEAAYLASAYPNAYLDLAFSLPPLDLLRLRSVVGRALGVAPASKIMCSSDGTRIPEHYWLGALRARSVLSSVLEEMMRAGELSEDDAWELGRMVLHDTAAHLYRLHRAAV